MAYTSHEWIDGETITAEKLNNIEEGIGEASGSAGVTLVETTVDLTYSTITLNITPNDAINGMSNGNLYCVAIPSIESYASWNGGIQLINAILAFNDGENSIYYTIYINEYSFNANSDDSYFTCYIGD